jgi:hypothetical protein
MKVILAAAASASILSACSTGQTIQKEMVPYQGQPVSLLIAKLGYPTDQQIIAGNKVYIWTTSNFVEGTNYACRIRAILNSQDIIHVLGWERQQRRLFRVCFKARRLRMRAEL